MADPIFSDYSKYPGMTHWFRPWLLLRLLNNVMYASLKIIGRLAEALSIEPAELLGLPAKRAQRSR